MKKHHNHIPAAAKLNLLRQICNFIPDFLVPKLARAAGVQEKGFFELTKTKPTNLTANVPTVKPSVLGGQM
jgi:hypothetical protein